MIDFLAVQVRLGRVTLEQIDAKFGADIAEQVRIAVTL